MLYQLLFAFDSEKDMIEVISKNMEHITKEFFGVIKCFSEDEISKFTWREILELLLDEFWKLK